MKVLYFFLFSLTRAWNIPSCSIRTVSGTLYPSNPGKKRIFIDIDGTICDTDDSNYRCSEPKFQNIELFNKFLEIGHEVHYWTARGANSGKSWDEFTVEQLQKWGVKYTSINMGKPHYDVWIDDKSINPDG
jgi:hypothetical protein